MKYRSGKLNFLRQEHSHLAAYCVLQPKLNKLTGDLSYLSAAETTYYNNLTVSKRIVSYLGGRYAAKKAVSELINEPDLSKISIERGVFDYPVVHYPFKKNIQVSLTHTGDLVVALAFWEEHPLSIDVERVDQQKITTLQSAIHESELLIFSRESLSPIEKLTIIWTAKEALSKVLRTGMMTDFSLFEIQSITSENPALISLFKNFAQYKVISRIIDQYSFSIVLPARSLIVLQDFYSSLKEVIANTADSTS